MCNVKIFRVPPVTLTLIALMTGIHLSLHASNPWYSVCIGVESVWYYNDFARLWKAAFFHSDDWHLYYNMVSFLYKGQFLERQVGSKWFLYMLAVFTAASNILLLYLNFGLAYLLEDMSYLRQCAVGFSAVIFGIKVVTTYLTPPGTSLVFGCIPVNSRSACWFELILIQLLVPNASFTGHLAGIIIGLAYVKGGLKTVMEMVAAPFRFLSRSSNRRSYTYASGTASNDSYFQEESFTDGLTEEEQMRRAMEESLSDHDYHDRLYPSLDSEDRPVPSAPAAPSYGWNIPDNRHDSDEMRRRRLARFDR